MKLNDLREFSKDDVLSALGLTSKPSTSERLLGGAEHLRRRSAGGRRRGAVAGAEVGRGAAGGSGERFRHRRNEEAESPQPPEAETSNGEART